MHVPQTRIFPLPTNNVSKKRGPAKIKLADKTVDSYSEEFDVKMAVIQELIPLELRAVAEELQAEVKRLAGESWGISILRSKFFFNTLNQLIKSDWFGKDIMSADNITGIIL